MNGQPTQTTGPLISDLTRSPARPSPNSDTGVPIEAQVFAFNGTPIAAVTAFYRIGFGSETSLPMTASIAPTWQATIPTIDLPAGQMLRWRVEATDANGAVTPFPSNVPAAASPRYRGTVATDPTITSDLPVLHWFVEDPDWFKNDGWDSAGPTSKPNNRDEIDASLFFDGRFYDKVQMRTRGVSASRWAKPKFKVELNEGDEFFWSPDAEPVDEFNLQSHFIDEYPGPKSSYIREHIQQAFSRAAGTPFSEMFHLQLRQNAEYHGLYSFTEQVDRSYLRRTGLEDDGALYKGLTGALASGDGNEVNYRKSTRKDEPYTDLVGLIDSLNSAEPERSDFVFDHLELPAVINKMAIDAILYNYDRINHNYYVYHQPKRDEWTYITWDTDLNLLINGRLRDPDFNHPLYLDGVDGRPFNGLTAAILQTPETREMYLRRLRTLMDTYLATSYLDDLITTLDNDIATERATDAAKWNVTISDVQGDIVGNYLPTRREQLFQTYADILPAAASASPTIVFGTIETNPSSGDQDEEFIQLQNPNSEAVDLSDWTVSGGIDFTFPPGSVIPAGEHCYLSPDLKTFRLRSTSPTGGEQHLVLGNYSGHLSNFSEPLTLADSTGVIVAATSTPNAPNPNQLHLIISELMYHPEPDGDAEFIELLNTSDTVTLDLSGVSFTAGIDYIFPTGTTLAPGARIVVRHAEFNSGSFSNGGETIKLDDADGSTIIEFTYNDKLPWPVESDTLGHSLVYISGDPDLASSWRASTVPGGNPDSTDSVPFTGGDLITYAFASDTKFNAADLSLTVTLNPGADAVQLTPQWSSDLVTWNESNFDYQGSGSYRLTFDPIGSSIFVRLWLDLR